MSTSTISMINSCETVLCWSTIIYVGISYLLAITDSSLGADVSICIFIVLLQLFSLSTNLPRWHDGLYKHLTFQLASNVGIQCWLRRVSKHTHLLPKPKWRNLYSRCVYFLNVLKSTIHFYSLNSIKVKNAKRRTYLNLRVIFYSLFLYKFQKFMIDLLITRGRKI